MSKIESNVDELITRPLESLLEEAWTIRSKNFNSTLTISAPGVKSYCTEHFKNKVNSFANISVTGKNCELNCEHCKRQLLSTMIHAKTPEKLIDIGNELVRKGYNGILISGGANVDGEVSFEGFFDSIHYLKKLGLKVIVHTGLIKESTAKKLKDTQIDQALIDIIGDDETIQKVYHLDKTPNDYMESLFALKKVGFNIAPHIVIGLNFGKITGEYESIKMISAANPDVIVLVILSPLYNTPMQGTSMPKPEEIARIAAITRIINPNNIITLGCIRPPGPNKIKTEKLMIRAGVNSVAYPMDETIEYAESLGLEIKYNEMCCSLMGIL